MSKLAPVFSIPATRVVHRETEILRLCEGKKILHVGCADAPYTLQRKDDLLHKQLDRIAGELWGVDTSPEGCLLLRDMGYENILEGDVGQWAQVLRDESFDVILAGEVIEHTNNAGAFLEGLAAAMNENTELLLTTVNAHSLTSFIFSLMRKEKVHPDHNYYFSYRTLKQLLEKCGLSPFDVYYYKVRNTIVDHILGYATYISPVLSDGLIVRATLPPV